MTDYTLPTNPTAATLALAELVEYAAGNRGSLVGNPYCKAPVQAAIWELQDLAQPQSFAHVETRYLGPTNHLGSRIKARFHSMTSRPGKWLTLSYDHELEGTANHLKAAEQCAREHFGELKFEVPGHTHTERGIVMLVRSAA